MNSSVIVLALVAIFSGALSIGITTGGLLTRSHMLEPEDIDACYESCVLGQAEADGSVLLEQCALSCFAEVRESSPRDFRNKYSD